MMYPSNQTWLLTNKGAVDFLTMSWQFPLLVSAVQQLQREIAELKAERQAKSALPATK